MVAILEAQRAGLLQRRHLIPNLLAGVVVGIVALPLAMAFAIASGARPEQGIYTAIVAGIACALLGGSRVQISGPTGAFIVILSAITAQHGIDGLQIASLMAGVILIALGAARLGGVIRFIPDPVIVGFTSGIAVIIWTGQWKDFFGLKPAASGHHFHDKLVALLQALPALDGPTTAIALGSLAILVLAPRFVKRVPAPLIALVAATAAQATFGFDSVATIGSAFGDIPRGLPTPQLPALSVGRVIELIGPAFTIAMLGAIESLLSAVVADGMAGTRHDSNQELVGQGIANVLAPLFGGFAATGAIARTATNIRNGGNSPLSGVVHALFLVVVLVALAPLARHVPLAVLAAILFVVAYNMSEYRHFIRVTRTAPRYDVAVMWVTFLLTVFGDLVVAVNVGVILAALAFMRRMSQTVEVGRAEADEAADLGPLPAGTVVYSIDGPLFFAATETFERTVLQVDPGIRRVVLRLRNVPFIDATGLNALDEVVGEFRRRGIEVELVEANARVLEKLRRIGLERHAHVRGRAGHAAMAAA